MKNIVKRTYLLNGVARWVMQRFAGWRGARGYADVSPSEVASVATRLADSWKDEAIPAKQRTLVERQLADYRSGEANVVFDALVDILKSYIEGLDKKSILEVGCSSGYYSEVLALKGVSAKYTGCDFSKSFIELARGRYPGVAFEVADATRLHFDAGSFDIVISGCCILHIDNYEAAIAEAARTTKQYVVFHRTPTLQLGQTRYFTKQAYGVEMMEIHFNEQALIALFDKYDLSVKAVSTHALTYLPDELDVLTMKTYLCVKN